MKPQIIAMKNTLIYLIGFPATGKYTIAREISALTGAIVIDNQLINNPVFSVVRADGKTTLPKDIWDYTGRIGDVVREAVVKLAPADENFVFTNFLTEESPKDHAIYGKIAAVAEQRNSLFVPVRLLCDLDALQSRITNLDRHERMKMTDAVGIAETFKKFTVLNPVHPHKIELDVTGLEARAAAEMILERVGQGQ
jgi:hypothetical protein